jgi:hypothetical protein
MRDAGKLLRRVGVPESDVPEYLADNGLIGHR